MKILLLTVTAGYGHHATAKALADLFDRLRQLSSFIPVLNG